MTPPLPVTTPMPDTSRAPEGGGQPPGDAAGPVQTELGHRFFGLLRLPGRRGTIGVLTVALLIAAVCFYFGADAWHSVLIGSALTTVGLIGLVGTANPDLNTTDWRGDGRPNRDGARNDVTDLSWSLRGNYGRVSVRAVGRVQRLARQRLARYQLDLLDPGDRPEIERLIGRGAYVVVRGERRPPSLRSLLHCLDVLDALDSTRPATPPSRSRRRPPIFAVHRPRRTRAR